MLQKWHFTDWLSKNDKWRPWPEETQHTDLWAVATQKEIYSICKLTAVIKSKLVNIRNGITEQNTKHHYAPLKSTSWILQAVPLPYLKKFSLDLQQVDRKKGNDRDWTYCTDSSWGELNIMTVLEKQYLRQNEEGR